MNQNQTHKYEVRGGFLWSPKTAKGGRKHYYYDTMTQMEVGDLVFSFYDTRIQAIGVVQKRATTAPKPDFGGAGEVWDSVGWLVDVEFVPSQTPFRPKDIIDQLIPFLPGKYSPLQKNGNGIQSVYLTEINEQIAEVLLVNSGGEVGSILNQLAPTTSDEDQFEEEFPVFQDAPKVLQGDPIAIQVGEARRGQGIFKHNLRLIESKCRLTGVQDPRHLRASHIKPWSKSTTPEKIDGFNGLLLSPHVDHLFDRGFISFKDNGEILRSPRLSQKVMVQWSLDSIERTESFNKEQSHYMEFHRDEVFINGKTA